jgi:hypothetical protein
MTDEPSKNGDQTGKGLDGKFAPGNRLGRGRPAGSRNRASLLLAELIDGEGEGIVRALVAAAKGGDVSAGRALLDRLVPARKDRPVLFALPPLTSATDAPKAMAAIVQAVASGDLTASEASDLAALVEKFVKAIEASELAVRLSAIEKQLETRK